MTFSQKNVYDLIVIYVLAFLDFVALNLEVFFGVKGGYIMI